MDQSGKQNQTRGRPAPAYRKHVVVLIVCVGVIAAFVLVGYFSHRADMAQLQLLRGNWARNDGEYTLTIHDVTPDGRVDARYFNPRPIHVEEARVERREGRIELFVKLEDVGYPGSTYFLFYDPDKDELHGDYILGGSKEGFQVVFTREKTKSEPE